MFCVCLHITRFLPSFWVTWEIKIPILAIIKYQLNLQIWMEKLDTNKSVGPYGICLKLLWIIASRTICCSCKKCQKSQDFKVIPDIWKLTPHITPTHKRGNKKDARNYRSLNTTFTVGRPLCSVATNLIDAHEYLTDQNDLLFNSY